ncbi:hypothetical protein [Flavobacterium sp. NKUCC04_CG]|uniref:hypothetical protein n=1 Tax=Flavobacterium sp. NKUCC04_CG TaxID=2842121 RepID=UPI001C5BC067|nr:hypothetical protein [Flavobacterium sp. NKUCC04_CG]MBW3519533.1 hypothetical protein [Flavobacterium sp. NKUCC04_CG]
MYKIIEIKWIFQHCETVEEVFEACEVFKYLREKDLLSNLGALAVAAYSCKRFREIEKI